MTSVLVRVFDGRAPSPSLFGIGCADPRATLAHTRSSIASAYSRMHPDRPPLSFKPDGPYVLTDRRGRILDADRKICDVLDLRCPTNQIDVVTVGARLVSTDEAAQKFIDALSLRASHAFPPPTVPRPAPSLPEVNPPSASSTHERQADENGVQQFYFSAPMDADASTEPQHPLDNQDGGDDNDNGVSGGDDDDGDGADDDGVDRISSTPVRAARTSSAGKVARGVVPVRKSIRHTTDGRWVSAKDIVYDALSLWGTNSVVPARATRLVSDRHPDMFEKRAVTGGGPHAPVVTVENIGAFCERLADAVPPPLAALAVEYPRSDRCADVVARLGVLARAAAIDAAWLPMTSDLSDLSDLDGGGDGRDTDDGGEFMGDDRSVERDAVSGKATEGGGAGTGRRAAIAAPNDPSAPLGPEVDGRRKRRATRDPDDDADYAEKARPVRRVRRRRRDEDVPTRASKRQRSRSSASVATAAETRTRDGPPSKRRRRHRATSDDARPPGPSASAGRSAVDDLVAAADTGTEKTNAATAAAATATEEENRARIASRIASRASITRPVRLWRWSERRWHLILEAKPSPQGIRWPWEITYEARPSHDVGARTAVPPSGGGANEWIEWKDLSALVGQCHASLHDIAVVSTTRQVPSLDALYGLSRAAHPSTGRYGEFDMGRGGIDDVMSGINLADGDTIGKDDVACVLDAAVPALCCRWLVAPVRNISLGKALSQRINASPPPSYAGSLGFNLLCRLAEAMAHATAAPAHQNPRAT